MNRFDAVVLVAVVAVVACGFLLASSMHLFAVGTASAQIRDWGCTIGGEDHPFGSGAAAYPGDRITLWADVKNLGETGAVEVTFRRKWDNHDVSSERVINSGETERFEYKFSMPDRSYVILNFWVSGGAWPNDPVKGIRIESLGPGGTAGYRGYVFVKDLSSPASDDLAPSASDKSIEARGYVEVAGDGEGFGIGGAQVTVKFKHVDTGQVAYSSGTTQASEGPIGFGWFWAVADGLPDGKYEVWAVTSPFTWVHPNTFESYTIPSVTSDRKVVTVGGGVGDDVDDSVTNTFGSVWNLLLIILAIVLVLGVVLYARGRYF